MNSAPEPTPFDVSDDLPKKAQTKRIRSKTFAMFSCLVGLTVPFCIIMPRFEDALDFHFCYAAIKPKGRNPDEPLCLLDADDLPDADVLVRASQEPAQAQKNILLRAIGAAQEQHGEQLLRASVEGMENVGSHLDMAAGP